MKTSAKIFKKDRMWYFIGTKYQGACADLYCLLMSAKAAGEMT